MKSSPICLKAPKRIRGLEAAATPIKRAAGGDAVVAQTPVRAQALTAKPLVGLSVAEQIRALADTQARSGWRLRAGLAHVAAADGGALLQLMERHGLPTCLGPPRG